MLIPAINNISITPIYQQFKPAIKKIAPISRKNNEIANDNSRQSGEQTAEQNYTSPSTAGIDKAEISFAARELFNNISAKPKQTTLSKSSGKKEFSSYFAQAYSTDFNEEQIKDIPSHLRQAATKNIWNAEKYVEDVRGGFIVSGANSGSDNSTATNQPDNIRSRYEMETVRFPGHLLSVLA